jgi:hypothetical protein
MRRTMLAMMWWLACGIAWAGVERLPPGAIMIDAATPKPAAEALAIEAGGIAAMARAGQPDAAFARLSAIDGALRFELVATRVIDALQGQPGKGGLDLLGRLEAVPVRVYMRQPETAADWFVPVFDLPAKARSARGVIARARRRDAWLEALGTDPASAVAHAKGLSSVSDAAGKTGVAMPRDTRVSHPDEQPDPIVAAKITTLADAIGLATPALAARIADEVAAQKAALPSPAQAALAKRSADPRMWELALRHGEPVDVLPLFENAAATLGEDDARAWLAMAARRAEYRSVAALALGQLPQADPYAALDDPATASEAAVALARAPDAFAIVERLLADPKAPSSRVASLALALRLIDTEPARARLRALRDDPRLPASVRAELQR